MLDSPYEVAPVDVSIVVMAYNEAPTLAGVLDEIDATMRNSAYTYEVLVVDDGSSDATGQIADEGAQRLPSVSVMHHPTNRGIGEVYRSGFQAATGKYLTFLPADGQFPANIVSSFVPLMSRADLVLGYLPEIRRSPVAMVLSWTERSLYRAMFGRLPPFQGIMMFRRTMLEELGVKPGGRGWGVLMEIIVRAKRHRLKIESVPTSLRPRASGKSKVHNLRSIWANINQAIVLWKSL
ncbi:MAG TPA: glycosyltransferase family 2 protein [Gemmatimonadaceae bacterium]|nr:glycosyltransferase family 2 protein [Gemmatimonadaceae bacterium]